MMLSKHSCRLLVLRLIMRRGKGGQTFSVSLAGVFCVQISRKFRRFGDPKTTVLHRLHTCASDCPCILRAPTTQRSNNSSRASSGSMLIDITWPTSHRLSQQSLLMLHNGRTSMFVGFIIQFLASPRTSMIFFLQQAFQMGI
jgi:hypothetical protein